MRYLSAADQPAGVWLCSILRLVERIGHRLKTLGLCPTLHQKLASLVVTSRSQYFLVYSALQKRPSCLQLKVNVQRSKFPPLALAKHQVLVTNHTAKHTLLLFVQVSCHLAHRSPMEYGTCYAANQYLLAMRDRQQK